MLDTLPNWYIRLLYTGDARYKPTTAGPLHQGYVPNATGIVACSILELHYNKHCRPAPRWTRSHWYSFSALYWRCCIYNKHCRIALRWICSYCYLYSRLLYTGDAISTTSIAGPLHGGHVPNTIGIVIRSILETLHV